MKMPKIGKFGRSAACILLVLAVFVVYELRLVQWQVFQGDEFEQLSLSNRTDTIQIDAARGEILDRNGNVLTGNRTSYNIVYDALDMDYSARNATILQVLDLLESRDEEWRDRLPIVLAEDGTYQYTEDSDSEIATLQEFLELAEYATAEDCMTALARQYDCQGYSLEDARNVVSVRYSMTQDGFSRTNPYVIAEDVSAETVGVISEHAQEWPGIETRVSVTRYYGEDGSLAPHVVGYTGAITAEQYDAAVENGTAYSSEDNLSGYKWTDTRGQSGLEAAFEEELRGSRGEETIYTDETGEVETTSVTTPPQEGNTVVTTIDSDLQRVANLSLAKNIEGNTDAKDCTAGAVVVLDVEDFGVLACSSYPTFDMNQYRSDNEYVNLLAQDEEQPLFNRALQGQYAPGSTFKMVTAVAGLEEGIIEPDTRILDTGVYTYYGANGPRCWIYNQGRGTHGLQTVSQAIQNSCNVFFYDVGRQVGIRGLQRYAAAFGLGEPTGIELFERTGIMAGPEYTESMGSTWYDGSTLSVAIGQESSQFTPVQLANYIATLANGGTRYQVHLLQSVKSYDFSQVLYEHEPVVLETIDIAPENLEAVKKGMLAVTTQGSAARYFADLDFQVGAKTGSAQLTSANTNSSNAVFVCFAPYDDPEVALALVVEKGGSGALLGSMAADILDCYFSAADTQGAVSAEGTLIR